MREFRQYVERRFHEMEQRFQQRFVSIEEKLDSRFNALDTKIEVAPFSGQLGSGVTVGSMGFVLGCPSQSVDLHRRPVTGMA